MTSNGSVPLGEGTSSTAQGTPLTNDYDRWSRYVTEYADFLADIDSDGEDGQGAFVRGSAGALAPRAEAELAFLERVDPDRAATFRAHLERTRLESGLSSAQAEAQRQELIARRQRQSMAQSLADSYADRREELLLFARGDCVLSEILRWFLQVYHRKYKEVDRPYGWDALAAGLLFEAGSTKLSRKQTSSGDAGPGAKASSSAPAPGAADDVTVVPASADKDTAPGDDGTPGGPAVSEPAPHLSIECVSELRAPLLVVPNDQTQPGGCPQVAYNNATSAAIYLMAKSFPSLYMIYPTTSVLHLAQWVEAELVPYSQRVIDRTCLAREAARETCVFAELPRREGRFYAWSRVAYRAAFPLVAAVGGLLPGRRLYSTALSRDMRARAETLIDLIDASLCPEPEAVGGLVLDADAAMRRLSEHPLFAKHFPEPYVPRTRGAQRSTPDAKRGADDNIIDPNGPSGRASPSTKLTAADIAIACALAPLLCADGTTIGSKLTMRVPSIGHLSAPGESEPLTPADRIWSALIGFNTEATGQSGDWSRADVLRLRARPVGKWVCALYNKSRGQTSNQRRLDSRNPFAWPASGDTPAPQEAGAGAPAHPRLAANWLAVQEEERYHAVLVQGAAVALAIVAVGTPFSLFGSFMWQILFLLAELALVSGVAVALGGRFLRARCPRVLAQVSACSWQRLRAWWRPNPSN